MPSGNFRTEDMVALGVSLAVALLICFVVIGILAYNVTRFNSDWKKLSEASIFRSSVSRLGNKIYLPEFMILFMSKLCFKLWSVVERGIRWA